LIFQVIIGGLLTWLAFKLAVSISHDEIASLWATLFAVLSPPLFLYHYLVYPELSAALLTTLVIYYAVTRNKPGSGTIGLVVIAALVALPWLNRRFVPLTVLLALLLLWAWRGHYLAQRRAGLLSLAAILGSLALLFWLNSQFSDPSRIDIIVPTEGQLWRRLGRGIGWLVDQQRGLFIYGPVYLLAVWGLPILIGHSFADLLSLRSLFGRRGVQVSPIDGARLSSPANSSPGGGSGQVGSSFGNPLGLGSLFGLGGVQVSPIDGARLSSPANSSPGEGNGQVGSWFGNPRAWFVILPFFLSLGVTTVAGGYWIAWELGPRFLVVALPALAPLIALAWRTYGRSRIWQGAALLLFALSLANSAIIIYNPELPYKSSLPLFYRETLQIPLTEYLPDLADYATVQPLSTEVEPMVSLATGEDGEPVWSAKMGSSRPVVKSEPLYELPFGHYRLTWPVWVKADLPPTAELGRISIQLLGGGQVFNKVISAADLRQEGAHTVVEHAFLNPNVERWRTPMILQVISNGQAEFWFKELYLAPDFFYGWVLPYLVLAVIVAGAVLSWTWLGRPAAALQSERPEQSRLPVLPVGLGWGVVVVILLAASSYMIYQQNRPSHTYEAEEFQHFAGRPIADPKAADGRTWLVDPMVDPPQKAIYGPFDIYEAGRYKVTFRIKLPEAVTDDQEIARLQVNATANFDELVTQPLRVAHFSKSDVYHDFVLSLNNPRRQALSFDVHYLGLAALAIDQVTITQITEMR
jgi:hypothetical protein